MAKIISPDPKTLKKLKKVFKASPDTAWMAAHVDDGVKVLQYAFAVMDATAKVKAPNGVAIKEVVVWAKKPNSKKAIGAVTVANWMMDRVAEQFNISLEDA